VQVLQLLQDLARGPVQLRLEKSVHAREQGGIDPIGLGHPVGRFGEASGLARVEPDGGSSLARGRQNHKTRNFR
jgi:hypothetical protein